MAKSEVFSSKRDIPIIVPDLAPVAQDVMSHFRVQGFEVTGGGLASGAWEISIRKGKMVKSALGTKLALNITLRPDATATHVEAGAGVLGASLVPAAISWYVVWPTALTRAWGLIKQAKLDDEAIAVTESSLRRYEGTGQGARPAPPADQSAEQAAPGSGLAIRCSSCRHELAAEAEFCPACGTRVT